MHSAASRPREYIGQLYGDFYFWVNLIGVIFQAFFVSRLLKWGRRVALVERGTRGGHRELDDDPRRSRFSPSCVWGKSPKTRPTTRSTTRRARLCGFPPDAAAKYAGKQAVDTVFVRLGDVVSALLVFLGTAVVALSVRDFALINLVLAGTWLWLARRLGRAYTDASKASDAEDSSEHAREPDE